MSNEERIQKLEETVNQLIDAGNALLENQSRTYSILSRLNYIIMKKIPSRYLKDPEIEQIKQLLTDFKNSLEPNETTATH